VLPLLRALIEKSLVIAEEADGETRYRMLETLRQHARDKLREAGEERELRRRHLEWFRDLAEEGAQARRGPDPDRWQRRLEREIENCRVALVWSRIQPEQQQAGLRLATAVYNVWSLSGHASEAYEWLVTLLAGMPANSTRAKALRGAGFLAARGGDAGADQPLLDEALSLARDLEDPSLLVSTLEYLVFLRLGCGDHDGARAAARLTRRGVVRGIGMAAGCRPESSQCAQRPPRAEPGRRRLTGLEVGLSALPFRFEGCTF